MSFFFQRIGNGKVFEAERMASNKSVFHKKCFTCQDCHRPLDSSLFNDGPGEDGLIFCNNCYLKRYGPTNTKISYDEFKKNVNAITLQDSSLKNCHRCQTVVYPNEQNVTNGRAYHRSCTRCIQCNRQLDQMSLFDAPDEVRVIFEKVTKLLLISAFSYFIFDISGNLLFCLL